MEGPWLIEDVILYYTIIQWVISISTDFYRPWIERPSSLQDWASSKKLMKDK